jgi:hypothetical protein
MECDILAGERGRSYTDASQIQNWKVVHIRFVESRDKQCKSRQSEPIKESPKKHNMQQGLKSSVIASVPLSQMLNLGKVIQPEVDIVKLQLEEFSVSELKWLEPVEATLSVQCKSFASGGSCDAFMVRVISGGLPKAKYVLKRAGRAYCRYRATVWLP